MTKFCVEDFLIEEIKEQDCNINSLLQEYVKETKTEVTVEYQIDNELIVYAQGQYGIDIEAEIQAALQRVIELYGEEFEVVIRRK